LNNNQFIKMDLLFLTLLIIILTIPPIVEGFNNQENKLECLLDNLRFLYITERSFDQTKFKYCREQLLKHYSDKDSNDNEIIEEIEPILYEDRQIKSTMSNGLMDSAWPMKCHDPHHTSQSPFSTIDTYAEIWRYKTSWQIEGGAIINNNGFIYFGCFEEVV